MRAAVKGSLAAISRKGGIYSFTAENADGYTVILTFDNGTSVLDIKK